MDLQVKSVSIIFHPFVGTLFLTKCTCLSANRIECHNIVSVILKKTAKYLSRRHLTRLPTFMGYHHCKNITRALTTKDTARTPPGGLPIVLPEQKGQDRVLGGGEDGWDNKVK